MFHFLPRIRGDHFAERHLSLTYDDGPGELTLELAEFLHTEGIAATFFVVGANVAGREKVLAGLDRLGHLVANHTYSHPNLVTADGHAHPRTVPELEATHSLIAAHVRDGCHLFRPPFGSWHPLVAKELNQSLLSPSYLGPIHWNIGGTTTNERYSADWHCWQHNAPVETCVEGYWNEISDRKRGIVLMHDRTFLPRDAPSDDRTLRLTRALIPRLKATGHVFVRLDHALMQGLSGSGCALSFGADECPPLRE